MCLHESCTGARDTVPHKEQGNEAVLWDNEAPEGFKHHGERGRRGGGGGGGGDAKNKFTHLSFTYNNKTALLSCVMGACSTTT